MSRIASEKNAARSELSDETCRRETASKARRGTATNGPYPGRGSVARGPIGELLEGLNLGRGFRLVFRFNMRLLLFYELVGGPVA